MGKEGMAKKMNPSNKIWKVLLKDGRSELVFADDYEIDRDEYVFRSSDDLSLAGPQFFHKDSVIGIYRLHPE